MSSHPFHKEYCVKSILLPYIEQRQQDSAGVYGLVFFSPNILSRNMLLYWSQAKFNEKEKVAASEILFMLSRCYWQRA
jgi:hypothetical protein